MARASVTSLTLLQRIQNGDESAWRRVVELYSPLVYYWCRRGGVDGADADDVLQEVLRVAAQRIGTFRHDQPGDTFRGWLRTITHRHVQSFWRARDRHPAAPGGSDAWQRLQELPDAAAATPADGPAADAGEAAESSALFHRALTQLRGEFEPRTWQAFWRTTVDDQKAPTVAAELGMTPTAVRAAKSRVLRRLREELGDLVE